MNRRTLEKWAKLTKLVKNPHDFVLDEHNKKSSPWIIKFRDGMQMEIRPGRGDSGAFRESFLQHDYLGPGQTISAGDTVVDIGANIGCFTIYAARAVGPTGRVIAVEPASETFSQLRRNVELNNLTNVTLVQAAVSGEPGTVTLMASENSLFTSLFDRIDGRENTGHSEQVEAITLDQILQRNGVERVDFLKVDCEGAEHSIVEKVTPETMHKFGQIAMEIHDVDGASNSDLMNRVKGFGYTMAQDSVLLYFNRSKMATV
jgi:FkbM family methyltransferase